MSFQKFQGDSIFTGTELIAENDVLITDESGVIQEIIHQEDAGDDIQKHSGILCPGFINCHCHLELSHMKGLIAKKTGFIDFAFNVVTQRHFAEEEIFEAVEKAEYEMIENGIVAVGDICNNAFTLAQKLKKKLLYYNFIETSGWLPAVAEVRFEKSKEYYNAFEKHFRRTSIVPHAAYSVSDDLWKLMTPYFANKIVSIHNQETHFEDELFLHGTGDFIRMYEMMKIDNSFFKHSKKSSLQTYFERLTPASSVILVHNTFTGAGDIAFAQKLALSKRQPLSFCICINANLYIENKMPPLQLLKKSGANLVLGTDSLASNGSLCILDEMSTILKNFEEISLQEVLTWATINGAKALQMEDRLGSFEPGKQPGVVLFEGLESGRIIKQSSVRRIL